MKPTLDLALVGNGTVGALINSEAEIVWACFPRFDGDPLFCSLLRGSAESKYDGLFSIELIGSVRIEQEYVADSAVLVTRFFDSAGSGILVTDFAPRFHTTGGDVSAPMMIVRRIERISGNPTIRVRVRPMQSYGASRIPREPHDRYLQYAGDVQTLRLTTDAPIDAVVNERPFAIKDTTTFVVGADLRGDIAETTTQLLADTLAQWRQYITALTIPSAWRDAVIRAAITLQLNVVQDTGAVIAAMTTSIPEAASSTRNWDYRYCWLRDAYFVVDALYRLGDRRTTARYVNFAADIVDKSKNALLMPLYSATGAPVPEEHYAEHLRGYRDMGPVRVGNLAHLQQQNDVFGEVILSALRL